MPVPFIKSPVYKPPIPQPVPSGGSSRIQTSTPSSIGAPSPTNQIQTSSFRTGGTGSRPPPPPIPHDRSSINRNQYQYQQDDQEIENQRILFEQQQLRYQQQQHILQQQRGGAAISPANRTTETSRSASHSSTPDVTRVRKQIFVNEDVNQKDVNLIIK